MVLEHDNEFYSKPAAYEFNDSKRVFEASEPTWEAYQVSDGAGGLENYQVSDGDGGFENYKVREEP